MSDFETVENQIREALAQHHDDEGIINAWVITYSVANPEQDSFRHGHIASSGNDFMTHLGLATYLKTELEQISIGNGATE